MMLVKESGSKPMLSAILKFMHVCKDEDSLDLVQMRAAKDRLSQRGDELTEEIDELSKMTRRFNKTKMKPRSR